MNEALEFLLGHGYAVLFALLFVEQIGLPIPSTPILLSMGALAASGRFSYGLGLLVALMASLLGDLLWYELGRRRGRSVLKIMCWISLEPDSCVRNRQMGQLRAFRRELAQSLEACERSLRHHSGSRQTCPALERLNVKRRGRKD